MKKIFKILFVSILITLTIFSSVSAISSCAEAEEIKETILSELDRLGCETSASPKCRRLSKRLKEAQDYINDNCSGCTIPSKPFSDENLNIPLNESGYILHKYSYNGESVFCIDPDTVYNPCATYNQGGNDLGNDLKVRII